MPRGGLTKLERADAALATVVGAEPMPRTAMVKAFWNYVKRHKLQDAHNRRAINADETLLPLFDGHTQITMFEVSRVIGNHLIKES